MTELTNARLCEVIKEVCGEDAPEVCEMSPSEALGFAYTLMFEAGIDDPEDVLRQRGILE